MSQYRDSMGNASDDVKSRVRDGMDSARAAASDTRDFVSNKFSEAKDRLAGVGDEIHGQWEHLRDTDYDEAWENVKDTVRQNPGPALLIAGAIGLALGAILAGTGVASSRRRF
jgi:ElaB/YqjD/DUF883 family membrane-anchored ribosome-binding protein